MTFLRTIRANRTRILLPMTFAFTACSPGADTPPGRKSADERGSDGQTTSGAAGGSTAAGNLGSGGSPSGGGSPPAGGEAGVVPGAGGSPAGGVVSEEGFVHPGILVNHGMLDFVRHQLDAQLNPWNEALDEVTDSQFGALSYTPHPHREVECGPYSNPDVGCGDEKRDCIAAYTHALLWFHTGNSAHADKAIEIMNAWSAVLETHSNHNAPLQSAWVAETFPRAAEIIRYTYDGWPESDAERFGDMLSNAYLPLIQDGSSANGNWEASMIEAVINIAVYNDDRTLFDHGVAMWRERTPAYIYLESDGPTPVPPPRGTRTGSALTDYWYGQTTLVDGLSQETCRDISHVQYGLAAIINAAETAYIQGVDLYAEESQRVRLGLSFHAQYINGAVVPAWLCGGELDDVRGNPMLEIALNHYQGRLGFPMPEVEEVALDKRPTDTDHHMAWETLTHADTGWAGIR